MELLGSKTAIKIIKAVLDEPLKECTETELIQKAKTGKGSAGLCIKQLTQKNIFFKRKVGKANFLSLNLKNPSVYFIKNIFDQEKLENISKERKIAIFFFKKQIEDKVQSLILFGSTIAGTATKESDIDVLVETKEYGTIYKAREETEELFGEKINIHEEALKEEKLKDPFLQNIILKGVVLYGQDRIRKFYSRLKETKEEGRLLFLYQRILAAERNSEDDLETANEIAEKTFEQLIFYLLNNENIPYQSRKDAKIAMRKLSFSKTLQKIQKYSGKKRIKYMKGFILDLLHEESRYI